jgi:hypothetical protein
VTVERYRQKRLVNSMNAGFFIAVFFAGLSIGMSLTNIAYILNKDEPAVICEAPLPEQDGVEEGAIP